MNSTKIPKNLLLWKDTQNEISVFSLVGPLRGGGVGGKLTEPLRKNHQRKNGLKK